MLITCVAAPSGLQSRNTVRHGVVQGENLPTGDGSKCGLQCSPEVFLTMIHSTNKFFSNKGPQVFNRIHIRTVRRPRIVVEHPDVVRCQPPFGRRSSVRGRSVVLELEPAGSVGKVAKHWLKTLKTPNLGLMNVFADAKMPW